MESDSWSEVARFQVSSSEEINRLNVQVDAKLYQSVQFSLAFPVVAKTVFTFPLPFTISPSMPPKRHPELEGYAFPAFYTFELKSRRKTLQNRLIWICMGLVLGLGGAVTSYLLLPKLWRWLPQEATSVVPSDNPFQQGVSQAMSAAELTQQAEFREEWSQVALLWQQAINYMKLVSEGDPNYAIAQQKIAEYQRNLQYAKSNVATRNASNPGQRTYWTIGSDRELVLLIQGAPDRVVQYDASCRETLYYGKSTVELKNGYVTEYSDLGQNLKVLADQETALSLVSGSQNWTLGDRAAKVFQVQGTPTRTLIYEDAETLFFGESSIEINQGRVFGYHNVDGNLKVDTQMVVYGTQQQTPPTAWNLGANRAQVLAAQRQPPTAVSRQDGACKETYRFGDSVVTFKNGFAVEYSNIGNRLKLQ